MLSDLQTKFRLGLLVLIFLIPIVSAQEINQGLYGSFFLQATSHLQGEKNGKYIETRQDNLGVGAGFGVHPLVYRPLDLGVAFELVLAHASYTPDEQNRERTVRSLKLRGGPSWSPDLITTTVLLGLSFNSVKWGHAKSNEEGVSLAFRFSLMPLFKFKPYLEIERDGLSADNARILSTSIGFEYYL